MFKKQNYLMAYQLIAFLLVAIIVIILFSKEGITLDQGIGIVGVAVTIILAFSVTVVFILLRLEISDNGMKASKCCEESTKVLMGINEKSMPLPRPLVEDTLYIFKYNNEKEGEKYAICIKNIGAEPLEIKKIGDKEIKSDRVIPFGASIFCDINGYESSFNESKLFIKYSNPNRKNSELGYVQCVKIEVKEDHVITEMLEKNYVDFEEYDLDFNIKKPTTDKQSDQ